MFLGFNKFADERYHTAELEFVFQRVNAAVVGPGLSRDPACIDSALEICDRLVEMKTPIVFDGVQYTLEFDALAYIIGRHLSL